MDCLLKLWRGKMIKSLFDILPIYQYEEIIDVSEWVKENQEIGLRGEEIVKKYLEDKYNALVTKVEDSAGYDLWVKIEDEEFAVEVKTTEEHKDIFFLTITEILKAKKLGSSYNIYRVVKKNDKCKVYIINDPIEFLNIDITVFKKGYENDLVQIYPSDVKIILKESVLEQFPCFDII